MIQGTVDTKDKFIAAVDAEVQEIRADKKREARFMKEQIELRRQLRKSREEGQIQERNKNTLGLIKALEKRGMTTPEIVAMIADTQSISQAEAQKYYDQLVLSVKSSAPSHLLSVVAWGDLIINRNLR